MKRSRIPALLDVIHVEDPAEIIDLNGDARIDRRFDLGWPILNWLIVKRVLGVLSVSGERFPTVVPRESAKRAAAQTKLGQFLDARVEAIRQGPEELDPLASWVRGEAAGSEIGIAVQQLVGQLFSPDFKATHESWEAARVLVTAPRSPNVARTMWWVVSGKLGRAKKLLAGMVHGDLSGVNGIGIAAHNIVNSLNEMQRLYSDPAVRRALSAEEAARQSLRAPVSLLRQPTTSGEVRGCPFAKTTLFVLEIGKASKMAGGGSLVFMDDSWSGCPASHWVPAMLQGVWRRAGVSA